MGAGAGGVGAFTIALERRIVRARDRWLTRPVVAWALQDVASSADVVLDAKLRGTAVGEFVLLAGLLHGYANGATMAPGGAGVRMLGWLARA